MRLDKHIIPLRLFGSANDTPTKISWRELISGVLSDRREPDQYCWVYVTTKSLFLEKIGLDET